MLALLAQATRLSSQERARIVSTLTGQAQTIARLIVGESPPASELERGAADGFLTWARRGAKLTLADAS